MKQLILRDRWHDPPEAQSHEQDNKGRSTPSGESDKENIPPKNGNNKSIKGNSNRLAHFEENNYAKQGESTREVFRKYCVTPEDVQALTEILAADKWDHDMRASDERTRKSWEKEAWDNVHRDFESMKNTEDNRVLPCKKTPSKINTFTLMPPSDLLTP